MLVLLARYPKAIAWFFTAVIYLELVLLPADSKAETGRPYRSSVYAASRLPLLKSWPSVENSVAGRAAASEWAAQEETAADPAAAVDAAEAPVIGGPGQPEMSAFSSVNANNMVDLFSGDFSYNIPLMDVGGYPIGISYRAGISMDQEASWVGLGWNINPGTVSRNLRGLPDDFKGDTILRTLNIKENKTVGVTAGADLEIAGWPTVNKMGDTAFSKIGFGISNSIGVTYNNYRGYGIEHHVNPSISAGVAGSGKLTGGLSIANSSMDGLTLIPSVSFGGRLSQAKENETTYGGSVSLSLPYSSRSGLKSLQLSAGLRQYHTDVKNQEKNTGSGFSRSVISFAVPSFTPGISIPYTSRQFSFTGKIGADVKYSNYSVFISGYVAKQTIQPEDRTIAKPAYGYLHYQDGTPNREALLDFNREKELAYREKPAMPHIAIPSYTYDAFSITGEGTGGMFRAYRGDIGFVYDHSMRTKDGSDAISVDIGVGDIAHGGIDLNINRAVTEQGPWLNFNPLKQVVDFKKSTRSFEAAYFRNPGEKTINDKAFYEALGGDDLVTVELYQAGKGVDMRTTNYLARYKQQRKTGRSLLTAQNAIKQERDKRTQVISYLTAEEADEGALSRYIENYSMNVFDARICGGALAPDDLAGKGLIVGYYYNKDVMAPAVYVSPELWHLGFPSTEAVPLNAPIENKEVFSMKYTGRLKAPVTGTYNFYCQRDDGARLFLNGLKVLDAWDGKSTKDHPVTGTVNLVAGEFYEIQVDYYDIRKQAHMLMDWSYPGTTRQAIPRAFLYAPAVDTFTIKKSNSETVLVVKEKRMKAFRKRDHISQITVLNNDGRRYIYGIPVYNLKQKEATFAVNGRQYGMRDSGIVTYQHGKDNTPDNEQGKDHYFSSEEVPAYAHSFLLTGIVSPDYSDITGNGISDDDIGDAVKFNYTRICGLYNPYQWRVPSIPGPTATFNEGLRTDYRDDKGNYVYGEKELWYMHSIESKTMVATFVLEDRADLRAIREDGQLATARSARRLKEINLYNKADFLVRGTDATPVKTVHFEYDYSLCQNTPGADAGKLTLRKIWFTYNGNRKAKRGENPYVFNYNALNPGYNIKSYDRWGNYKDPLQNPGSLSAKLINNAEYPYALQDSLLAARNAGAWSLDSIQLPTGGAIKVQYESDDYAYVQQKRAMQLFKIVGLNSAPVLPTLTSAGQLYGKNGDDNLYIFIKVPKAVSNTADLYQAYLAGVGKLYFRLFVEMPKDNYSNGNLHEYVSCYADLEDNNAYGIVNASTIWVKIKGISLKGANGGSYSPLVKAASQFLRMNLPSKAYPGSETADQVDLREAVQMMAGLGTNIVDMFKSFDRITRENQWVRFIDTSKSFVRLTNPSLKKYGGGHRVKRVLVYDNWNTMTGQRAAVYGQEYSYTTRKEIGGKMMTISSGVASYEPGIGGDENPFHEPVEYIEKVSALGPITLGYSEEPLGESFFPAAGVGYSSVRTRTIHYKNKKSANGFEETNFYTAYDYPVYTDRTLLDADTKKRFRPAIGNFLRINARHHINISQGFRIELNDMHGRIRSKAYYPETDSLNYVSYSEYFYRNENNLAEQKRLSNTVMVIRPDGSIDTAALIGKDVELMMDMREMKSVTNGYNVNLNTDMFSIAGIPPVFLLPSLLNLAQREENIFRSVATVKVIQRYGILDSLVQVDKGSKITTRDLLYDSETGDVVMTRTQNEFNDPVFNFNYPSHWAYDGMGAAYKNIDVRLDNVNIRDGRIEGLTQAMDNLFASGDEILVAGKQRTGGIACDPSEQIATFPNLNKIWCIDSAVLREGPRAIYFIDRRGNPYTGLGVSMRVIRSGRRNMFGSVGSVTSLDSLVRKNESGQYVLSIGTESKIIAAASNEFRQYWKVDDIKNTRMQRDCSAKWRGTGNMRCLKDVNGKNTGYQEMEMVDVNPYSQTLNDTTWINVGLNCYECTQSATWANTALTRCAVDSQGNNTGWLEVQQQDTSACSETSGQSRWVTKELKCDSCLFTRQWVATGQVRCATDANGNKTGYQEIQFIDTSFCGRDNLMWAAGPLNCSACAPLPGWKATGQVRCAKDANSINTGYQEREELDTTLCGNSQKRWVSLGLNCTECSVPENWKATGVVRCVKDANNNNTGYQEREERDSSVCGNNAVRWVSIGLNCATCTQQPGWKATGNVHCQQDANGNYTGYQEREERDTTVCGSGAIRWVVTGYNCMNCTQTAGWKVTGNVRCVKDAAGNNTGYQEREERDTTHCNSDSLRWVSDGQVCANCPKPQLWQSTGQFRCLKDANNHNTGQREREERNMEPCSLNPNATRWLSDGENCYSCPTQANVWVNVGEPYCFSVKQQRSGYLVQPQVNISTCSDSAGQTRDLYILRCDLCPVLNENCPCNPEECRDEDGKKCINGVCVSGVWTCYLSQEVGPMYWNTHWRWKFPDGTWSEYVNMNYTDYECGYVPVVFPPDGRMSRDTTLPSKDTTMPANVNLGQSSVSDIPELNEGATTAEDRFYRSVLPAAKYIEYQKRLNTQLRNNRGGASVAE
ncbi:MAG: PA14 domain-containing protein [Candidatus Pseudobacter hemicellulosilyticus]|uniref:PA14 domain-containing protein n=1 Tax=Candidatus Pseudobacter hemicellulosilyticus TaxID=3121375 RepID=A0AAJ6BJI6_9BACT|nr:MAG: PA14 domain-containing protein [Pseudobacter sp.]